MRQGSRFVPPNARIAMLGAALLATAATRAGAQSAIYGAGLQAWLGCWSAELSSARDAEPPSVVCITPTADVHVADVLTVQDGRVTSREVLDASGRQRPIEAARCAGTRSASWSRDGRRLFVRSAGTCAGVPSLTSGLLTITADGDWLDVEGISAGGGTSVRVARYRDVTPPAVLPLGVRSTLSAQALATRSVRVAAGAPVQAEDLLEAARVVDSAVLEAWVLEGAQRFAVSDAELRALLGLGLPRRVADALGAVADPESYTLARGDDRVSTLPYASYSDGWSAYGLPLGWGWGWGSYLPGARRGAGYRDPRRYGHYRPPIVIVRGHDGRPRGRGDGSRGDGARGRGGYPAGDGRRAGTGSTTERPASRPPSGDPRHSSPQQGAGSGSGSGSGGGTVRLARPRG